MSSSRLERALDFSFVRQELLRQALTHRSHSSPHNERLEFLGDSVLNCAIATLLFDRFPLLKEGDLSRLRANLVRQESLAEIAGGLGLGDLLLLGEGELKSGGFRRPSILADALEALLGAIYLDAGFDRAFGTVKKLYDSRIADIDPKESAKDAKTSLQEWLQGRRMSLPHYALRGTLGDAHAQEFTVECRIQDIDLVATGKGPSRRAAEQAAAQAALGQLRHP